MSKKDKKIEIRLVDSKVTVNNTTIDGFQLVLGKRTIGDVAELDNKFAVVKDGNVEAFYKTMDAAIESIIENFNLNH